MNHDEQHTRAGSTAAPDSSQPPTVARTRRTLLTMGAGALAVGALAHATAPVADAATTVVRGATGPTGPTGPTGATGPAGLRGATGAAGTPGNSGGQGATGTTGPTGPEVAGPFTREVKAYFGTAPSLLSHSTVAGMFGTRNTGGDYSYRLPTGTFGAAGLPQPVVVEFLLPGQTPEKIVVLTEVVEDPLVVGREFIEVLNNAIPDFAAGSISFALLPFTP